MKVSKQHIRSEILNKLQSLDSHLKEKWDHELQKVLFSFIEDIQPRTIHSFIPMDHEVNHWPVLETLHQKGITIIIPQIAPNRVLKPIIYEGKDQLKQSKWGTWEPLKGELYEQSIDLIICPGLAFDPKGGRLGYGGGYYDRFLKLHPESQTLALCYPFMLQAEIPTEAHDIRIKTILCKP
ncbi:5-formyltetrahydrofolate cyclo-ligase [Croceimicrobium hydrocarbonivorans]|uniref:5-formyltetrahydrofolate cyclo-ligase n=1 Tax=Croceimicrobium hydrocarbonivorans TaxID=2761580 RepID=A0A7H0VBJ3_9FLAO|nr:5-formyltetrahydrofolate cyclo-ligase [Croceimicrobium hydrocarbonivorans]QNR23091.1 5-formyltetrahydrofolate cyclo-ligase [Croceimicrobium hydrocarbonivorans]